MIVRQMDLALTDAGIIDEDGTLRWRFRPGVCEVSSFSTNDRVRLGGLLSATGHVIDDFLRKQDLVRESLLALRSEVKPAAAGAKAGTGLRDMLLRWDAELASLLERLPKP